MLSTMASPLYHKQQSGTHAAEIIWEVWKQKMEYSCFSCPRCLPLIQQSDSLEERDMAVHYVAGENVCGHASVPPISRSIKTLISSPMGQIHLPAVIPINSLLYYGNIIMTHLMKTIE